MAAPKKPEGEKIEQIKVHVRKSEKEIYTRKLFEGWMEQHRAQDLTDWAPMAEGKMIVGKLPKGQRIYSENEQALIDMIIAAYRKSTNQIHFINRAKTLM